MPLVKFEELKYTTDERFVGKAWMVALKPVGDFAAFVYSDGLKGHDTNTEVFIFVFQNGGDIYLEGEKAAQMFHGMSGGHLPRRSFEWVKKHDGEMFVGAGAD